MALRPSSTAMNSSTNSLLNMSVGSTILTPNNKTVGVTSSTPSKQTSRDLSNMSPVCAIPPAGNFAAVAANNPSSKPASSKYYKMDINVNEFVVCNRNNSRKAFMNIKMVIKENILM